MFYQTTVKFSHMIFYVVCRFDQDMQSVHEELRTEKLAKEKTQRERDQILSEKYSFEQEVTVSICY